jgi:hypothetical protein
LTRKLTLSMDEKDIRAARRLAQSHGTSISGMFSRLVRVMARRAHPSSKAGLPPLTRKLSGIISLPKGKSDREIIEEAILERHGLNR